MRSAHKISDMVKAEISSGARLHGPFNSAHEAYAVLLEELDEVWDEVKKRSAMRDAQTMVRELVQVAAVAQRFAAQIMDDAGRGEFDGAGGHDSD